MSLASSILDLSIAIRDKFNSINPRLLSPGGLPGQIYVKNQSGHGWENSSSGSSTSKEVFVQESRPSENGPWLWWKTDNSGNIVDLIINDGT